MAGLQVGGGGTFSVSPGITTREFDLTNVVAAVSTTEAGIAGPFQWGPVDERVFVTSEDELVKRFQKPSNTNFETFFTAANFLSYGSALYVVRTAMVTGNNASQLAAINACSDANTGQLIKNADDFYNNKDGLMSNTAFVGRFPGALGNSLKISVCDSANAFSSTLTGNVVVANGSTTVSGLSTGYNTQVAAGDLLRFANNRIIGRVSSVTNSTSLTLTTAYSGISDNQGSATREWRFKTSVAKAPGTSAQATALGGSLDEIHVVVYDEDGQFTGTKDQILEIYANASKARDAKDAQGDTNFYKDLISQRSQYVWSTGFKNASDGRTVTNYGGTISGTSFGVNNTPKDYALTGGQDGGPKSGTTIEGVGAQGINKLTDFTAINRGYDLFSSPQDVDISLLLQGKAVGGTNGTDLANFIIGVVDRRKDSIAFISPERGDVVGNEGNEETSTIAFRNSLDSTSYAVLDSGYKYQYDKYSSVYRYVPLNGDTAGTCVRTDLVRDTWFSPAGFNRGGIKNVTKLSYNPNGLERDRLYTNDINPVVSFPGQGTVLFGDKTLLGQPSAFDRINVRRLFISLEKAISQAAQFSLFEFNDEFTRAQFRNLVEPFLRDVQGRRGIFDFRVVCDTTNNTAEVIDRNEFIGDIYVKPNRSINFIQLNFVAVRSGVEFAEIVGQF